MPAPEGYVTKMAAITMIRQRTGYGRFVIEKKMAELEAAGNIRFHDNPGNERSKVISKLDVEKIVAALSLPPPE